MTPACTVCGYAVEWVRSCFTGTWRLFRGRPDVLTLGRYVFLPDGSPHYPFWHNLGSRDWTSDERDPWPALGETDAKRGWSNGAYDGLIPRGVLIGSPDCIENGERFPLDVIPEYRGGFAALCYEALTPPPPAITDVDIRNRETVAFLAQILVRQYDNPVVAQNLLQLLVPTATITRHDNSPGSIYPGTLIAVTPQYTVVVVSGTSTPEQLALQILYAGGGPNDYGWFRTNPVWLDAAYVIHSRIVDAGADPSRPILFVGYSYGGAASTVLGGIYLLNNPNRDVRLLTIGSPSPGDAALVNIIRGAPQVHINAVGDPVPSLPPQLGDILALGGLVPEPLRTDWQAWQRPPGQQILLPDGTIVEGWSPTYSLGQLATIASEAILGDPFTPYATHSIEYYWDKLKALP